MATSIRNGWHEVERESFWAYYKNAKPTGFVIIRIPSWITKGRFRGKYEFHVRHYPSNRDIGSRSTLAKAKQLAESS